MKRALSGVCILIVEDDADNLELLEYLLREEGAAVVSARNGAQVQQQLQTTTPDVVVSDLTFPGEDGCALLATIRAREATARVPAIAFTAHAEDTAILRAVKAGFDRHMAKPAEIPELVAAIAELVGIEGAAPDSRPRHKTASAERLAAHIVHADLFGLVRTLNAGSSYRFTSLARFDGASRIVLAAFDREAPEEGALGGQNAARPVADSYCAQVLSRRTAILIEDAQRDTRAAGHPLREVLRAYCGVPILRADGSVFGSLFHSALEPVAADEKALAPLGRAARMLRSELPKYERVATANETG